MGNESGKRKANTSSDYYEKDKEKIPSVKNICVSSSTTFQFTAQKSPIEKYHNQTPPSTLSISTKFIYKIFSRKTR